MSSNLIRRIMAFLILIICSAVIIGYIACDQNKDVSESVSVKTDIPSPLISIPASDVEPMGMEVSYTHYAMPPEEPVKPTSWTVSSGDNLWKIAENVYDNGCMYPYLMEINNMKSDIVLLGQVLKIEYFDSYSEYQEKLKECYQKIKEWNKPIPVSSNSNIKNGNTPSNMSYVGKFFVTGYDAWCAHCCGGNTTGVTASGRVATVGRTVATSNQFPMGTKLYVEGYGTYVVEDRGCAKGVIDIAADSHEACGRLTRNGINVYIVN